MDVNILSTAGDVVMRHPLITFIEDRILILNINKKKAFNTIEQLVHSSILSLLFSSLQYFSRVLHSACFRCSVTARFVPRTARLLRFTNRISFHLRLIFT